MGKWNKGFGEQKHPPSTAGFSRNQVMRLRQPGMQAPEAVPRFGGPAVPTALVPMVTWFCIFPCQQ